MKTNPLVAAKFVELVNAEGSKIQFEPGWRGKVAAKLGISGSLLSQICSGEKKITSRTLQRAIETQGLPANFFDVQVAPPTIPPPAQATRDEVRPPSVSPPPLYAMRPPASAKLPSLAVDPLLIVDAFRALPPDTRERLLTIMRLITHSAEN